jgi:hypothetical protein
VGPDLPSPEFLSNVVLVLLAALLALALIKIIKGR